MAKFIVTSEQHYRITGQLLEIQRQLRTKGGSPINPEYLKEVLQGIIEPGYGNKKEEICTETKMFDPRAYFKDRDSLKDCYGLQMTDSFRIHILSRQKAMPYRGLEGVTSSQLKFFMSEEGIVNQFLGGTDEVRKHPFTLDQIAAMIDLLPNSEDGDFLNNGGVIIFPVLVGGILFAVNIDRTSISRSWGVGAWRVGDGGHWGVNTRVFRNTIL